MASKNPSVNVTYEELDLEVLRAYAKSKKLNPGRLSEIRRPAVYGPLSQADPPPGGCGATGGTPWGL